MPCALHRPIAYKSLAIAQIYPLGLISSRVLTSCCLSLQRRVPHGLLIVGPICSAKLVVGRASGISRNRLLLSFRE